MTFALHPWDIKHFPEELFVTDINTSNDGSTNLHDTLVVESE